MLGQVPQREEGLQPGLAPFQTARGLPLPDADAVCILVVCCACTARAQRACCAVMFDARARALGGHQHRGGRRARHPAAGAAAVHRLWPLLPPAVHRGPAGAAHQEVAHPHAAGPGGGAEAGLAGAAAPGPSARTDPATPPQELAAVIDLPDGLRPARPPTLRLLRRAVQRAACPVHCPPGDAGAGPRASRRRARGGGRAAQAPPGVGRN